MQINKELVSKIKQIESLTAYFDIKIQSPVTTDTGVAYALKLDPSNKINWETSKKLMFGSLVCLSSDYFDQGCLIGVICERNLQRLKKDGIIYVKFQYDASNLPTFNRPYIMLETSAFFESYKHVLQALVSFQPNCEVDFPFKENIVFCKNTNMQMPQYLKNACLDFRYLIYCTYLLKK